MQCRYCTHRKECSGDFERACFSSNFNYNTSHYTSQNNSFIYYGKKIGVYQLRGNHFYEGEVVHIIPYGEVPSWTVVRRFYFDGDNYEMRESKHLASFFSTSKYDRIVLRKPNGSFIIFPYNLEKFIITLTKEN